MVDADATVRAREGIQRLLGRRRTELNLDGAWVFELADEVCVVGDVDATLCGGPMR